MRCRHSVLVLVVLLLYHIPVPVTFVAFVLLPFCFQGEPPVPIIAAKMRSPSAEPTPQSFRANLKELSATDRNLQNENFKLKMQIYHMRGRLKKARADDHRRESYATPKIDNFYEEENDDDYSDDARGDVDEVEFENDNQVIRALQDKLEEKDCVISNLEEENKSLWDAQDDMKANMKNQTLAVERLNATHASFQAKAEGSRLQMDAAVAAMEEAQNDAQESRKRLAEATTQIKHEQARADTITQSLGKEKMRLEAAENGMQAERAEAERFRMKVENVSKEMANVKHNLCVEIERREVWEAARNSTGHREGYLANEPHQMARLLKILDEKRMRFESETEYDENWRESVNGYLKECLKALYTLEVEVDAKRRAFVTNNTLMQHPKTLLT